MMLGDEHPDGGLHLLAVLAGAAGDDDAELAAGVRRRAAELAARAAEAAEEAEPPAFEQARRDAAQLGAALLEGKAKLRDALRGFERASAERDLAEARLASLTQLVRGGATSLKCASERLRQLRAPASEEEEQERDLLGPAMDALARLQAEAEELQGGAVAAAEAEMARHAHVLKAYGEALGPLRALGGPHVCPVCMTDEVTTALLPCGHTFCSACALSAAAPGAGGSTALTATEAAAAQRPARCFMCRAVVERRCQLFFSV